MKELKGDEEGMEDIANLIAFIERSQRGVIK